MMLKNFYPKVIFPITLKFRRLGQLPFRKYNFLFYSASAGIGLSFDKEVTISTPDASKLTPAYLLRQASNHAVDAATVLFNQAAVSLLTCNEQLLGALERLNLLLELNIQSLGNELREEKVWDAILSVRLEIAELKSERESFDAIYQCALRTLSAAGEAALIAGADHASTAAGERLQHSCLLLDSQKLKLEEALHTLNNTELLCIEETVKHEKQNEKLKENELKHERDPTDDKGQEIRKETAVESDTRSPGAGDIDEEQPT